MNESNWIKVFLKEVTFEENFEAVIEIGQEKIFQESEECMNGKFRAYYLESGKKQSLVLI